MQETDVVAAVLVFVVGVGVGISVGVGIVVVVLLLAVAIRSRFLGCLRQFACMFGWLRSALGIRSQHPMSPHFIMKHFRAMLFLQLITSLQ